MNQRILALLLCSPLSSIACSGARVAVESPVTSGAHGTDAVDVASPDATTPADGAADDASTRRPWDGAALAHDAAVRRAVASCRAGDGEVAIALEREVIEAECEDEFRHCRVSLGIRVTNCASRPVALRGVHVTSPGGRRAEWSVELVAIAPGASDTTRVRLDDEREEAHQLEASAIDDSGERAWRWSGSFRVANPDGGV